MEGSTLRRQENNGIINNKVIQHVVMEEKFPDNFQIYVYICQGLLREFFIKVPDRVFPNRVREFYLNLKIEYISSKSSIRGV